MKKFFSQRDRQALKWCSLIMLILMISAVFCQFYLVREKNITVTMGLTSDALNAQNSNQGEYSKYAKYTVESNRKNKFKSIAITTPTCDPSKTMTVTLDDDQSTKTTAVQTSGGKSESLEVFLCNWDGDRKTFAECNQDTYFKLGINKRTMAGSASPLTVDDFDYAFVRLTDIYGKTYDFVLLSYTITAVTGQSVLTDNQILPLEAGQDLDQSQIILLNTLGTNMSDNLYACLGTTDYRALSKLYQYNYSTEAYEINATVQQQFLTDLSTFIKKARDS